MDAIDTLKLDVQEGRIGIERLVDLVVSVQRQFQATQQQLQATQQQLQAARQRIEELERKSGGDAPAKLDEPFSMRAEEQRQQARGKKKHRRPNKGRRGRFTTADKLKHAERTEDVFPEGVAKDDCWLSHTRPVWRLENGRAILIAYRIFRGPNSQYGQIPAVLGRSEFGLEIVVEIAFFVYVVGLSFDKVRLVVNFCQNLTLSKSQIDSVLHQLSRHWHKEFETLCTLLANSAVVHADETGWSLNSVWAFLSEKARVTLFGVHKDAATLAAILDPTTFAGILISDDAAVYANFTVAQKCWAHLLRKAIKLTLQVPENSDYRDFTDRLLEIYRAACRVQCDGRVGDGGRARKVAELEDAIVDLCAPVWLANLPPLEGPANDYRRLAEVKRWQDEGRSCFAKLLDKLKLPPPVTSVLDQVLPHPGG